MSRMLQTLPLVAVVALIAGCWSPDLRDELPEWKVEIPDSVDSVKPGEVCPRCASVKKIGYAFDVVCRKVSRVAKSQDETIANVELKDLSSASGEKAKNVMTRVRDLLDCSGAFVRRDADAQRRFVFEFKEIDKGAETDRNTGKYMPAKFSWKLSVKGDSTGVRQLGCSDVPLGFAEILRGVSDNDKAMESLDDEVRGYIRSYLQNPMVLEIRGGGRFARIPLLSNREFRNHQVVGLYRHVHLPDGKVEYTKYADGMVVRKNDAGIWIELFSSGRDRAAVGSFVK